MDQDYYNEVYEEEAHQQFEESMTNHDWNTARLVLADLEEKKFSTYELRRRMNVAMNAGNGMYIPMDSQTIDQHIYSQLD